MKILKRIGLGILINAGALYVVVTLLEEVTYTGGFAFFIIGGIVIGFLNAFVKPILQILSLPLVLITVGIFIVVINAFILWFTKYFLDVLHFRDVAMQVSGLGGYLVAALVFGLVNWGAHLVIKTK